MITLRAPSGASQELAHAIELVNRDLGDLLAELDTEQQNEFWSNLHQFALAETHKGGRKARLIAAGRVNTEVREALQLLDDKIASHLAGAGTSDRQAFWRMVHDVSEQQARDTKQTKARHGRGGESA